MGLPKTVRLDDELEKRIELYLKSNDIKFPQLLNLALEKFISEPQVIELIPVKSADFARAARSAFEKHKDAMDKLK